MIDTKAQELKFLIRHNKKEYAAGAAVVAAALAAGIYLGKFYTGWIGVPLTEDLFFIDRGRYLADTWIRQGDDYMYADGNAQMSRGIMTICTARPISRCISPSPRAGIKRCSILRI